MNLIDNFIQKIKILVKMLKWKLKSSNSQQASFKNDSHMNFVICLKPKIPMRTANTPSLSNKNEVKKARKAAFQFFLFAFIIWTYVCVFHSFFLSRIYGIRNNKLIFFWHLFRNVCYYCAQLLTFSLMVALKAIHFKILYVFACWYVDDCVVDGLMRVWPVSQLFWDKLSWWVVLVAFMSLERSGLCN